MRHRRCSTNIATRAVRATSTACGSCSKSRCRGSQKISCVRTGFRNQVFTWINFWLIKKNLFAVIPTGIQNTQNRFRGLWEAAAIQFQHCFCSQVLGYWRDAAHTITRHAFLAAPKRIHCMVAMCLIRVQEGSGYAIAQNCKERTQMRFGKPPKAFNPWWPFVA